MSKCRSLSSHCCIISTYISKAIFFLLGNITVLCLFTLSLCMTPGAALASMSQLSNNELMEITGREGVSINLEGSAQFYFNLLRYSDTQPIPQWIELHDFTVTGASGGDFYFSTHLYDEPVVLVTNFLAYYAADPVKSLYTWATNSYEIFTDPLVQDGTIAGYGEGLLRVPYPIQYDVATDGDGHTFISIVDTSHINPRWYSVGEFVFAGQSLGAIDLDALSRGPSLYRLWAHSSGISFNYQTTIHADALTYTYNTTPENLSLKGIHIVGSVTGDPTSNPATWVYNGTFKIGTIGDTLEYPAGNTPATMDVATDGANNTSIYQSLPMAGSVRVEQVLFGGRDFGPIAIDGIRIHRFDMKISPGVL